MGLGGSGLENLAEVWDHFARKWSQAYLRQICALPCICLFYFGSMFAPAESLKNWPMAKASALQKNTTFASLRPTGLSQAFQVYYVFIYGIVLA